MLKHYKNKNWVGTTNYEQNLQDIKQDVETLKRNVSYIYKHGTLGGGGTGTGGEVISDDQIVLNYSPTLLSDHGSNICYTDSTGTCKFTFYIKTQTTAKPYSVKITDDKGLVLKSEFTVTSSKNANEINVNLIGLGSTEKIIITAVDKNDIELSPVSIYIKCNQYSVSLTQDNAQSIMDITNIYQTASQFNIMTSCYVPSTTEATITVSINGKTCLNANVNTMGNTLLQYTFGDLFSKGFGRGSKPIIGQRYAITVTFNVYANTEFTLTTNPYYITIMGSESLGLMAEVSGHLGHKEDAAEFTKYSEGCKKAYQELVSGGKYDLDTDRQAQLVRPLALDLLTEEQAVFAKKRLIQALENYGWRLGTGFLSTPLILGVLSEYDLEAAYRLLENEEIPGWLSMPCNGATTIWENWDGPFNSQGAGLGSLNHYSKGAVCKWLFDTMCGIRVEGKNHFVIAPKPGGSLTHAGASYNSIYGNVESRWEKAENGYRFTVVVPANCTATVALPDGSIQKQAVGTYTYEIKGE